MALIGINLDRKNPEYTVQDFLFWQPQYKKYFETEEGETAWKNLYPIANGKIFKSIFGVDWTRAMSLCIAHYLYLLGRNSTTPSGNTLSSIAGGTPGSNAILTSANIGAFSKTFDPNATYIGTDDAKWWNLSSYGAELMALLKTKAIPSVFVVTSNNPVPYQGGDHHSPTEHWPWSLLK